MARIRFTNVFAERIGGVRAVEVSATTVESALHVLTERYPELTRLVWSGEGTINPVMAIFLNDRQLGAHEFAAAIGPGDEIDIVPAVEGGSTSFDGLHKRHNKTREKQEAAHRRLLNPAGINTSTLVVLRWAGQRPNVQ